MDALKAGGIAMVLRAFKELVQESMLETKTNVRLLVEYGLRVVGAIICALRTTIAAQTLAVCVIIAVQPHQAIM